MEVPDYVVGVGAEGGQVGRYLIDRLKWRHLELIAWDPQTSGPDLKRGPAARGRVLIVNGVVETPAMFRPVRQLIEKEYVGVKIGCTALAANSAVFAGVSAVDLYSPIVTTTSGKIELPWAKGGRYEHSGDRYMFGDAGGSMTVFGEQMDEIVRGIADEIPKV